VIETINLLERCAIFLDQMHQAQAGIPTRLWPDYEALWRETASYRPKEKIVTEDYDSHVREYLDTVSRAVFDVDEMWINEIASLIAESAAAGHLLLVAGNGGSHCTALHFATDLEKCICDALPIEKAYSTPRVHVLGENPGIWSAWSNDIGWTGALARQIETWGRPGSLLLLLSASGESSNLIHAASAAKKRGLRVMALIGQVGSSLERWADLALVVGTEDVQAAEDVHSVVCHALFREVLRRVKETCGVE